MECHVQKLLESTDSAERVKNEAGGGRENRRGRKKLKGGVKGEKEREGRCKTEQREEEEEEEEEAMDESSADLSPGEIILWWLSQLRRERERERERGAGI